MDSRVRSRIDANDVLQETFIDVKARYRSFIDAPAVSLFVWFRQLTLQVLIEFQRRHFRQKRTVQKEVRLNVPQVDPPFPPTRFLPPSTFLSLEDSFFISSIAKLHIAANHFGGNTFHQS